VTPPRQTVTIRGVITPGYEGFLAFCRLLDAPLADFQRDIAQAAFAAEREIVCVLPRGNAKTTTSALLALHHLVAVPHASVALGAASREQASIAYAIMRDLAQHPALSRRVEPRLHELRAEGGGLLRVVSGRGERAHGRTDSLMILDELWAQDGSLLEAFQTSLVKRSDARLVVISTPAASADSPLGKIRQRALSLPNAKRTGPRVDAHGHGLRWIEWSLPEHDSLDDLDAVAAANPAPWITRDLLAEQHERVTPLAWATFHAGRWNVQAATWLPAGAWQACKAEYTVGLDEPVTLGVDIGGTRAATALVGVTDDLRVSHVLVWHGDDAVLKVLPAIEQILAGGQVIEAVVYDEWRWHAEALRLERDHALRLVSFPQREERLVRASEGLHAAVVERRLQHPGDPDLDRHIAAAIAVPTRRGWRLDRRNEHDPTAMMDAVIALAMACATASAPKPEPVETRLVGWL